MSKNAASEEKLGRLHAALADVLIEQLEGEEIIVNDETGETKISVDPAIIRAAISFLHNNNITSNPFLDQEKLSEVERKLGSRVTRFTPRVVDPDEAARRAAGE